MVDQIDEEAIVPVITQDSIEPAPTVHQIMDAKFLAKLLGSSDKERPVLQGGGSYTKTAPRVRRVRRRRGNKAAKVARRANR